MNSSRNIGWKDTLTKCILALSLFFVTFSFSHDQFRNTVSHWKQTEQCVSSSSKLGPQSISFKIAYRALFHPARHQAIEPHRARIFDRLILVKLQNLSRQRLPETQTFLQYLPKTNPASSDEDELNT